MNVINHDIAKTEHIHVRKEATAAHLVAALCYPHEHLVYDEELSKRAGYTVLSVRIDEDDPATETGTVSYLGTRYEINDHHTGATICIWFDEN